jgi:two-component system sensor histidine kinase UhpB
LVPQLSSKNDPWHPPITHLHLCIEMAKCVQNRSNTREQLEEENEKLRALTTHLQSAREDERNSMAREIHDGVAQSLTRLKFELAWLHATLAAEPEPIRRKVESISSEVDAIIQAARRIASELRPPLLDDFGLTAAIEWQLEELAKKTGIRVEFRSDLGGCTIEEARSIGMFRILEEALKNAVRHSKPKTIKVSLLQGEESLELRVTGTGTGARKRDVANEMSLGLLEMHERVLALGGALEVAGVSAGATNIAATIPLRVNTYEEHKEAITNHIWNSARPGQEGADQ